MAINSQNSRRSVLGIGLPSNVVPPLPKGVIKDNNTDGSDLKEVAGYYRSNFISSPTNRLITAVINLVSGSDSIGRSQSVKNINLKFFGESQILAGSTNRLISSFSSIGMESNVTIGSPLMEQVIVATATLAGIGEVVAIIPSNLVPNNLHSILQVELYLQRVIKESLEIERSLTVPVYINRVQTFTLYRTS